METQPLTRDDDSSELNHSDSNAGRYRLVMSCSDGSDRIFELTQPRIVIGRLSRSDIHVALPMIGPRHCELVDNGNGLMLTDLGSEAGTQHNGQTVKTAALADGDRIGVGPIEFTVRDRGPSAVPAAEVTNSHSAKSVEVVVLPQQSPTADA